MGQYGFILGSVFFLTASVYIFSVHFIDWIGWTISMQWLLVHTDNSFPTPMPRSRALICLHRCKFCVPVFLRISVDGENKIPVDDCSVPMGILQQSLLLFLRTSLLQNSEGETEQNRNQFEQKPGEETARRLLPPTHTLQLVTTFAWLTDIWHVFSYVLGFLYWMKMQVREVLGNRGSEEVLLLCVCPLRTSFKAHLTTLHCTLAWRVLSFRWIWYFLLFTCNYIETGCS